MHRFAALLRAEIRFQRRHGFYVAYAAVCLLYIGMLHALPASSRGVVIGVLVFVDTSVLGFIFVGGIELLERAQGVDRWLFVSPARLGELIGAKVVSLTVLSLAATAVLYAGALQLPPLLPVLAACLINAVFFTLFGIILSLKVTSMNGFFLLSVPATLPFVLIPLLIAADILPYGWLLAVLPTTGTLALLLGETVEGPRGLVAMAIGLLWVALIWPLCVRTMRGYASRNAEVRP
jgi:fluoroquinolone transport system permease protein